MIVVDASVLAPALAEEGEHGRRVRARLNAEDLMAPEVVDLEVLSAWRGLLRSGKLDIHACHVAVADLSAMALQRVSHRRIAGRIWALRENLSANDAAYVALAEAYETTLLTADARLARAPGIRCEVEVLTV